MTERDGQGREALAKIIYEADDGPKHGCDSESFEDIYQRPWLARADAVLDWLKAHDAEVAAAALRDAADEFADGHQADKPRLRDEVPTWLRARADESNPR